ncbi:hypothetical protein VPH35_005849 [Triticum aestivum]
MAGYPSRGFGGPRFNRGGEGSFARGRFNHSERGGFRSGGRFAKTDRFGSLGRGIGRFGVDNGSGREEGEEAEFDAEDKDETLRWQAKTGKKEVMDSRKGLSQKDRSAQQQLLATLLSQLVQGLKGGELESVERSVGKAVESQTGKETLRREEGKSGNLQKADRRGDQDPAMDMKKIGGKNNWQINLDESRRGGERFNKQVCGKCKDPRHSTRECRVGHCLVCGRENHITSDCNLLKQIKPVPKYVGYAAKGLGILLVQSYKDMLVAEHTNPLVMVIVREGKINETELTKALGEMFDWGWQWRVKEFGQAGFMMRFPNKVKLVELAKFNDFNLLGTGVVIKVQPWSLDHQAVGKMHAVWVRISKVPDYFRHFLGMCEFSTAVGPVLEVDMDTINEEKVRVKCGVRDVEKIPPQVEITAPHLLMFRVCVELEMVVEVGWYKEEKRKNENLLNPEEGEGEADNRKRTRVEDYDHRAISLGCLSLKQSEEVDGKMNTLKKLMEENMQQWQDEMYNEKRKWQKENDILFNKVKILEEDKARHQALWAKNEQKIKELEDKQCNMQIKLNQQQEEIQKLVQEAVNREQYEMELANMDLEDYDKENQHRKSGTESGKYNEPTDYNAS